MAQAERSALAPVAMLPPQVTRRLLEERDAIARRMARRLADDIPLPSDFRRVGYLRSVVSACREGLGALLRLLHEGRRPQPRELARLGEAGARQAEIGVPLEVLLAAYRLAAKIVWREVIATAVGETELPPATVVAVTEQVLEYLDEVSAAVGRAYLETRERLMRQRDRERDRILQRLLAGDASPELRRLAASQDVRLAPPYRVLACSVEEGVDADRALAGAWRPAGVLLVADEPGTWIALVTAGADIEALTRDAAAALRREGAAGGCPLQVGVGPVAVSLGDVAHAARRARQALLVGPRLRPDRLVHDDRDVGVFAALASDPDELRRFSEHVLGRLLALDDQRGRDLLHTLETVLETSSLADAAAALGLHRHTIVYRLQRLRELLGTDLDDPRERHRLWLAVQAQRLLPPGPAATASSSPPAPPAGPA